MFGRCTICLHADRFDIDQALVNRRPFRQMAASFGVSTSALVRHRDEHLPLELAKARSDDRAALDELWRLCCQLYRENAHILTQQHSEAQQAERRRLIAAIPSMALRRMKANAAIYRLRSAVIARDGYVCGLCGGLCSPDELEIDHVHPVALGGSDDLDNLQVAHGSCNASKGARFVSPPPVTLRSRRHA